MSNNRGSKFHPSRVSGIQKFLRNLDNNRQPKKAKKKGKEIKFGEDWSIKN
jgi:hypothetical protein